MRLVGEQWVVDETDATGARWQDLYPPLADEGDDRAPWTLAVDSDGGLWAGMIDAVDGVWRRDDGVWHRKELPGEAAVVVGLAADPSGGLYVATRSGVVVWQDDEGAFVSLPAAIAWHPPFQLAAGGGVVWAITWEELLRFDGEAWLRFPVPNGAHFGLLWVDPGGAAWLPAESGAIRFDGEVTGAVSVPYPGERSMQRIAVASDGAWWIVGSMGLYRWAPEEPWPR